MNTAPRHTHQRHAAAAIGRAAVAIGVAGLIATSAGLLIGPDGLPGRNPSSASALAAVSAAPTDNPAVATPVRYDRDIRQIFSDRCFKCHGPDPKARQADLRLDDRDSALRERDGVAPIAPRDVEASELWRRVTSDDPLVRMPPPDSNKKPLSAEERERIAAWIDQGAEYEPHWSFVPPTAPPLPEVHDAGWCRNDIDRFILANLEARGVKPSPQADKATLLRRVMLDLTGLPPTLEELDAFEADGSPDTYERIVDRLLNEEPYRSRVAERLTAPWLDAARYADTCGIHTDNGRQMWLWRDWVLHAFRDNMPFDQFLIEQLAGDLLPEATLDQKVATGFNRNHVTTDEGGAIAAEYLVEYAVDRASTTSAVFLGLTAGCARCHDHKFDPLTQQDFYSLYAFFNSIEEPGLYTQTPDSKRAYEPFIDVPTPEQARTLDEIKTYLASLAEQMQKPFPGEQEKREAFTRDTVEASHVKWSTPEVIAAQPSDPKVTLTLQDDGSVLASGPVPAVEDYTLTLKAGDRGLRLLLIEALAPAEDKAAGRAPNRNAVMSGVTLAERVAGSIEWTDVPLRWAWADSTQQNGDHEPVNVLLSEDKLGWAIDGHRKPGSRLLLLAADRAFAAGDATELRVTLSFRSPYPQHSFERVRVRTAAIDDAELSKLPLAFGRWQVVGPFPAESPKEAFEKAFGPETIASIDLGHNFGSGNQYWKFDERLADERPIPLAEGLNATYVGRDVWSPDQREIEVHLGSDDGLRLFVNGVEAFAKQVDRPLAPNQDATKIQLKPGRNSIVFKVVNTGGQAGYYFRAVQADGVLKGDMTAALLPAEVLTSEQSQRLALAWRRMFSPEYLAIDKQRAETEVKQKDVQAAVPLTMVMKELPQPRETFVLERGVYDKPDKSRPVSRSVPRFLGELPADAPKDRLSLARWLTAPENPLVARVAVNRFWEMIFGTGIVATSEDFGYQGAYPTHPELLDALAIDFREHGWDVQRLLREIVTSSTYRQASRVREDLAEIDPSNAWLSYYPRRRLSAEQIRDLALYASGQLVEKLGGPSVKPYQPEGLWQEVAMLQSNTREFVPGEKDDLYRRSLYTYWKRASPPPSLQTFDAPTREACVIRRPATNTPLQALVLMNDVQYIESARVLAQRTLASDGDDASRIVALFRRCTGRAPNNDESSRLLTALNEFRSRYAAAPADAEALLAAGQAMRPENLATPELAAWTMIASAALNLHETVTQD